MVQLALNQATKRFQENDERMEGFVNGDENGGYTSSNGADVPSIQRFLAQKDAQINADVGGILSQVTDARDMAEASAIDAANIATSIAAESAILDALPTPTGAATIGVTPAGAVASTNVQAAIVELDSKKIGLYGNASRTVQVSDPDLSTYGERIQVDNPTGKAGYGVRFAFFNQTGDISTGRNAIGDALLSRWSSMSLGSAWGRWDVASGPLPVGSGLAGAPTLAQNFFIVTSETNPQNRYAQPSGWQPENRLWGNVVGGDVMVPETQDFNGVLGATRIGFDIVFGKAVAKSPYTANYGGVYEHAKFLNAELINPNAIAPGGFGLYATGLKDYPTAIAISFGGLGYSVGDMVAFSTGLSQSLNENTQVKVLAVNGSGAITSAEIYIAGSYSQTFALPVGVTGGTGTGATFSYTLSTSVKTPQACVGIGGKWVVGIDCCNGTLPLYAKFSKALIRIPSGQELARGRNAADTADVVLLKMNTSDHLEIVGKEVLPRPAWAPTFTADAGSFTTVSLSSARYSQINGIIQFQLTFQIVTVGTATGGFLFTLPTVPAANYQSSFSGSNISDGIGLSCSYNSGAAGTVRCLKYDATSAIAASKFYTITGTYEA